MTRSVACCRTRAKDGACGPTGASPQGLCNTGCKHATAPASVPAVLETPMTTPAYFGAMSMWFTEKPPRAKPQKPSDSDVIATPTGTLPASGMSIRAAAAPQNPAA